ncbi:MAG: response regulator [Nitrosopumilus sp.]|nr:response regulator [Nitrosopumilus sp.]MDF2423435.1 response regulator [Nitrosopumilus sp.]MDF2424029.1 response regulator [Nitrosopumilus sp.]MDF2428569.1 response regulator [Nitrosopumilus sp.]MDF2430041.1 response regulator [Nitrosopumilus sp.]
MKILGIDDNFAINELLDNVLNASGHEFSYVNNGKEGLKLIQENNYDIVLLDLSMPEFTGVEVIDSLNNGGIINKQKIIIFTASSFTDSEIEELLKNGAHSCIRKPIDIDLLLEKIDVLDKET